MPNYQTTRWKKVASLCKRLITQAFDDNSIAEVSNNKKFAEMLVKNPEVSQLCNWAHDDYTASKKRLEAAQRGALEDLNKLESHFCTPVDYYTKNIDQDWRLTIETIGIVNIRKAEVQKAMRAYLHKRLASSFSIEGVRVLAMDQIINEFLQQCPNFSSWEQEDKDYKTKTVIIENINLLKTSDQAHVSSDQDETNVLIRHIQIQGIARYFLSLIDTTQALSTIKITQMKFSYCSKKSILILKINDKSMKISGQSAKDLYKVLNDPYKEHECEEFDASQDHSSYNEIGGSDKAAYDRVYRRFERICNRIYRHFIAYGITDFVKVEKYGVLLNQDYADLVQEISAAD